MTRTGGYFAAALVALTASAAHAAGGAPQQLLNKTVTMSWTTSGTATAADGQSKNFTNVQNRIVYVSTTGRPFLRATVSGGKNSRSGERGPEDTARGNVHFEGGKLVGVESFMSGARQFIATFDGSYSSCTVSVIDAKAGNAAIQRRGPDGIMYKVENVSSGAPSCAIQAGNAFAGQ